MGCKQWLKSHGKFKDKYKIKFDLLATKKKFLNTKGKEKIYANLMGIIETTYLIDKKGKILKI